MELRSLQSPSLSSLSFPSQSRNGVTEKHLGSCQVFKLPTLKRHANARSFKVCSVRAQASGVLSASSAAVEAAPEKANVKDENLVFVAGATGKVGSRTVRELLKLGFRVRAGVRNTQRAESLVQSVKRMKLNVEDASQAVEKLEIVECDLEKRDTVGPALGNASVVICCIGASEKEVFDITGPYRIDYKATKNLVEAATAAKVDHFILVTSLGTNKFGFPAAILNLFWGVLCWKRRAEEALVDSGLPYTIVRPGGMERPTDAYKETHNITLSQEDTLFGGQVSNLQVAELMAVMAKKRELAYCKVVEVIAETTAPLTPMEELLAKIPSKRPLPKVQDTTSKVETDVSKVDLSKDSSTQVQKETPQEKPTVAKPLSPYTAYEDLKPPTSPTPTPSTTPRAMSKSDVDALPEVPISIPSSVLEQLISSAGEEAPKVEEKKTRPLSPYTAYDDLKPPTSPIPTPSGGQKEKVIIDAAPAPETPTTEASAETEKPAILGQKTRPLSPYAVYEDLKPPTSPSPIPSGSKDVSSSASTSPEFLSLSAGGNDATKDVDTGVNGKDPPQKLAFSHSPYNAYDDLKPPTSPSPSAPNGWVSSASSNGGAQTTMSSNGTSQPSSADKAIDNQNQSKSRPLSPYTMYEDLKPPSSPSPSPENCS